MLLLCVALLAIHRVRCNVAPWMRRTFKLLHKISESADFVLSVTAADFDLDGDVDVAAASFLANEVSWFEKKTECEPVAITI